MTYEEALAYIHSFGKFVRTPGLDRMKELMYLLGNPQENLKVIHIAGTNGKGSTAAMLATVLKTAGYKTGMYTSPFIYDFCERIQVDGELIPKQDLVELVEKVKPFVDKLEEKGEHLAEFEFITALGFLWFASTDCDLVVLETGLGGRLDATNIIENPLVTVLTSISLDHTKILGDTVEKIAREKAGTIKENVPVVCYLNQPKEVLKVIRQTAKDKYSALIFPELAHIEVIQSDLMGNEFLYKGTKFHTPLVGKHQINNAVVVLEVLEQLRRQGYSLAQDSIKEGLLHTKWPGRIQVLRTSPTIVVDGAHNLSGIEALVKVLESIDVSKVIVLFGMLEDKDYKGALKKLAPYTKQIVLVTPNHPRAVPIEKLLPIAKQHRMQAIASDNIKNGVKHCLNIATNADIILVCGSLYMIGEIERIVEQ